MCSGASFEIVGRIGREVNSFCDAFPGRAWRTQLVDILSCEFGISSSRRLKLRVASSFTIQLQFFDFHEAEGRNLIHVIGDGAVILYQLVLLIQLLLMLGSFLIDS